MNIFKTHILIIKYSFWAGMVFVFLSIFLFTVIIVNRLYVARQQRRHQIFLKKWRPILLDNLYSIPTSLTAVPKRDTTSFLLLWNHLQEILKEDARDRLAILARSLEIDKVAIKMLASRKTSKCLLALSVLGNLRKEQAWDKIEKFVNNKNMLLSLTALNALAKINPTRAVQIIIDFMVKQDNWPDYKIANILYEIGSKTFSEPLAKAILSTNPEKQARLLTFMRFANGTVAVPIARKLLKESSDTEVISACLNLLGLLSDIRDARLIKDFIKHPASPVRIRAVSALGNIADDQELHVLEECLSDSEWWVRYRAAQAISTLPSMNRDLMEIIKKRQTDRFAVDILNYVISEKWE